MAIATVLKTVVRKDLGVRIPRPPLVLIGVCVLALLVQASLLGALCGRGEEIHRANLRSDLRNLVTAQEGFRADSGRFTDVETLIALDRYRFSTGTLLDSSRIRDDSFIVRLRARDFDTMSCSISVGIASAPDGEPVCDAFDSEVAHARRAVVYAALLALALGVLVWQTVVERRRVEVWYLFVLAGVAVAHPFWDVPRSTMRALCSFGDADFISLALAAFVAWYFLLNPPPRRAGISGDRTS